MSRGLTRRRFLSLGGQALATLALGGFSARQTGSAARASLGDDLVFSSVSSIAQAIREKRVSSTEIVTAYLKRIDDVNPWLNAVVELAAESAMSHAREADAMLARGHANRPLHGVPMTIKDSLDTRGVATAWGVPARATYVPAEDATVVARLLAAGAILLGKTNTPELTLSFETNSPVHGATNNPYDVNRTAGGSSGGAAAIVAAGGSPFDIGSDTGGSVRLPAHCCGVTGIRPTSGRVPRTGNAIPPGGLLNSLTGIGPLARYVDDLGLLLPIISGPDRHDPAIVPMSAVDSGHVRLKGLRGTFHTDNGIRSPTKESVAAVWASVEALADAGVAFEERRPPGIEQTLEIFQALFSWDGGAWRRSLLTRAMTGGAPPPDSGDKPNVSTDRIVNLIDRWDRFRTRMLAFMAPFDVLVCPVNAFPALPHGKTADNFDAFSYTMTYSLTDWPAVVVRAGTSPEDLPIGVQIVAPPWREDVALAVAAHVEYALGGWRPPEL